MCYVIRYVQSHLLFCFNTIRGSSICFDLKTLYFVATEIYDYVMEYVQLNKARPTGIASTIQNHLGLILNHYKFYHVFEQWDTILSQS